MRYLVTGAAALALAACATPAPDANVAPNAPTAVAAPAPADPAALAAERTARMATITPLIGLWKGPGWRNLPTGRVDFAQTVIVEPRVGGLAMSIQGQSVRADGTPPGPGSFAVVHWDETAQRYAFRSFVGGAMTDADAVWLDPDTFQWIARVPGALLRFTVQVKGDQWLEKGERSTDGGASWSPTNEVTLTRQR